MKRLLVLSLIAACILAFVRDVDANGAGARRVTSDEELLEATKQLDVSVVLLVRSDKATGKQQHFEELAAEQLDEAYRLVGGAEGLAKLNAGLFLFDCTGDRCGFDNRIILDEREYPVWRTIKPVDTETDGAQGIGPGGVDFFHQLGTGENIARYLRLIQEPAVVELTNTAQAREWFRAHQSYSAVFYLKDTFPDVDLIEKNIKIGSELAHGECAYAFTYEQEVWELHEGRMAPVDIRGAVVGVVFPEGFASEEITLTSTSRVLFGKVRKIYRPAAQVTTLSNFEFVLASVRTSERLSIVWLGENEASNDLRDVVARYAREFRSSIMATLIFAGVPSVELLERFEANKVSTPSITFLNKKRESMGTYELVLPEDEDELDEHHATLLRLFDDVFGVPRGTPLHGRQSRLRPMRQWYEEKRAEQATANAEEALARERNEL